MKLPICAVLAAMVALAPVAVASTTLVTGVERPALRVDAQGNAEVSWTSGGGRRTLLVPPAGRLVPGGRLSKPDVSVRTSAPVPFAKVVRRTPDGRMWALQTWSVTGTGPPDLRIARWRGAPTQLSLTFEGAVLAGRASFHGAPLPRYSRTFEGTRMRVYVYLDAWRGGAWHRLGGVAPKSDGSFRRLVAASLASSKKFRAVVTGPVVGGDIAPDAAAVAIRG